MRAGLIVLLCVAAAIAYGIIHDQITARVCVEYFTVGHPPVFPTDDPTLLGLGWGIIATWWVGLVLGLALAVAARGGSRPPRGVRSLLRPVALLLMTTGAAALAMGLIGYAVAEAGGVVLVEPLAGDVPHDRHTRFLADLWAHTTSYIVGAVGGLVVCVNVWRSRYRRVS
ncbi:hypothetical protein J0H58_23265 [bacterium]|nr:hypothetical protein [bacterium]